MSVLRLRRWFTGFDFIAPGRRIALALAFSWLAGLAPAQAQFLGLFGFSNTQPAAQLAPQDLVQRLGRAGFRVVKLRLNGNVFLADVTDRTGQPLRLVVNAHDGAILQRFATASPRMDGPNGGSPSPGFAPSYPVEGEASPGARPRAPAARARPAASEATLAPGAAVAAPAVPPPVAAAPPAPPAPLPPMVGPGFANGVPINPLD